MAIAEQRVSASTKKLSKIYVSSNNMLSQIKQASITQTLLIVFVRYIVNIYLLSNAARIMYYKNI